MTIFDLLFLASVLFLFIFLVVILVRLVQGDTGKALRAFSILAVYLACYAIALFSVSLLTPRRFFPPGQRQCFDDWCVAASTATRADLTAVTAPCVASPGNAIWILDLEVSSSAKRVRQRARDARAMLEDQAGIRYGSCGSSKPTGLARAHALSDELGPEESFHVSLAFSLPATAQPAGAVMYHGAPGNLIIGDDHSFLHAPALLIVMPEPPPKEKH